MLSLFKEFNSGQDKKECEDLSSSACKEEPRNRRLHVAALALSKSADGFMDPKLVLSWLLTQLGSPLAFIGLLVPVREAGALLPQLFTTSAIHGLKRRKWAWASGSFVQGIAALSIGAAAFVLTGFAAGLAVVLLLAVLALARSVCSVSYKDVLGKTVSLSRRGSVTGLAASVAATLVIVYALLLSSGAIPRMTLAIGGLFLAGLFWLFASFVFSLLREEPDDNAKEGKAVKAALANIGYLKTDPQLRQFVMARGLLTATALAPPFLIAAGSKPDEGGIGGLGFMLLASSLASLLSSYVWGKMADRSSRSVLIWSAASAAAILGMSCVLLVLGFLGSFGVLPLMLFGIMISYQGVRLGRSTHLVDMADEETRAPYTAVSNTLIGVLLLAGGLFSIIAQTTGILPVLVIMSAMCIAGAHAARGLDQVQ